MEFIQVMLIAVGLLNSPSLEVNHVRDEIRVTRSYGGDISFFIDGFAEVRNLSKDTVVIDGPCLSACTLALGLIPEDRLCATERGLFGFHSAWYELEGKPVFSEEGTRMVWNLYPEKIKQAVKSRGWDGDGRNAHPDLLYIRSRELVKGCD